jgi:V-type H+-transporting ATPase subunit a
MGFFSTYCGFIYNDFGSIPLKILGESCYNFPHHEPGVKTEASVKPDCVYPFGIDPIWYLAKNELTFVNSLKMKIAVILGVAQMALGVCMKGLNSSYFNRKVDFFFEFLPQIIMLIALFGYMDALIFIKWMTNYDNMVGAVPPSVISQMINMGLNFGE